MIITASDDWGKLVESFVECEAEHRAWVPKHLGIIEKIGYENYLIEQLG